MSASNKKFIGQLVRDGRIRGRSVINAFLKIDRANFAPDDFKDEAYLDIPIPILSGMTTSQPSTIAFMLDKLQPRKGEKVLEVGTGSGYLTALLSVLVGEKGRVFSIEYFPELKSFAESNLHRYDFKNVALLTGDGKNGLPQEAPFDKIVSSAEVKEIPQAWGEQLKIGGSILTPIDSKIVLAKKAAKDKFNAGFFSAFSFVPLL